MLMLGSGILPLALALLLRSRRLLVQRAHQVSFDVALGISWVTSSVLPHCLHHLLRTLSCGYSSSWFWVCGLSAVAV